MPTFFEKKQLVTPGELLAEGDYLPGDNTYLEENKVYAQRIGLVDCENKRVNVVALRAFYVPTVGDLVIGAVIEVGFNGVTLVTGKSPEDEELAITAIREIEHEFPPPGLTDRITQFLKEQKVK